MSNASGKIPCSIGILTLNSGRTLRRCLDSVKEFSEIVICDGNSTDDTLQIAQEYGCKIVKQYDSDEPNLSSVRDKANVRNRNMDAASCDWYIYLDSDDALSPEAVAEIHLVVMASHPRYLVYRMPLHIIISDTKVVKYSSNYPFKQLRLFNRMTGARFRGKIHERITFDTRRYAIGNLSGYYDNHWPTERVRHVFAHMRRYAQLEAEEWTPTTPGNFLSAILFRLRSAARVLLISLWNYPCHGFKETMPFSAELARLYYQLYLLWLIVKKQLRGT